jgi:hypothetical protein
MTASFRISGEWGELNDIDLSGSVYNFPRILAFLPSSHIHDFQVCLMWKKTLPEKNNGKPRGVPETNYRILFFSSADWTRPLKKTRERLRVV